MLTRQQHRLLTFIDRFTKEHGWSPTYAEMRIEMCLASKGGINRLIMGLVERQFIVHRPAKARSIEVIRLPGDAAPTPLADAASEMLAALKEIAKGHGAFSIDPLEHASNTIDEMKGLARAAIAKAEGRTP
jgi:repressor LexA